MDKVIVFNLPQKLTYGASEKSSNLCTPMINKTTFLDNYHEEKNISDFDFEEDLYEM